MSIWCFGQIIDYLNDIYQAYDVCTLKYAFSTIANPWTLCCVIYCLRLMFIIISLSSVTIYILKT